MPGCVLCLTMSAYEVIEIPFVGVSTRPWVYIKPGRYLAVAETTEGQKALFDQRVKLRQSFTLNTRALTFAQENARPKRWRAHAPTDALS